MVVIIISQERKHTGKFAQGSFDSVWAATIRNATTTKQFDDYLL